MNKLGFYIQRPNVEGLFDAMRVVRPPVMVVQTVNRGWLEDTRRFSPETFIVGRLFLDRLQQDQWLSVEDPDHPGQKRWLDCPAATAQGRKFAEHLLAIDHPLVLAPWPYNSSLDDSDNRLLVDAWMTLNEFVQGPASDDYKNNPEDIRAKATAYDCFQVGFRQRLKEAHPRLEAVAFNFGAGNFPDAKGYLEWFPRTLESYVYLGFHEYGWPTLYPDAGSATSGGSYRRCMAGIREKYGPRHKAIMTEAGLARMFQIKDAGDVGWLYEGDTVSEEDYWRTLKWYNDQLSQDDYVVGACLYNVGYEQDWRSFRHTGANNEGQPIRIMDRICALREEPVHFAMGEVAGAVEPPSVALKGRVAAAGRPVPDAKVRLLGRAEELGSDPRAAAYDPTAITWTRTLTGFQGHVWNCWQQYVAPEVAGITWEEFRVEVLQYNPALAASQGRFKAGQTYLLPELKRFDVAYGIEPEVVWDRSIMGFAGDRWTCWQRYVRTKVPGLTWAEFRKEVGKRNPHLKEDSFRFFPDKSYLLPRDPGQELYTRVTFSGAAGRYRFDALQPGRYKLEVSADGYQPLRRDVKVREDRTLDLELERFPSDLLAMEAFAIPTDRADVFVDVQGRDFVRGGMPFRFIGVNLRGLAHYGTPQYPLASQRDQLNHVREMGASVVRIFLPHRDVPTGEVNTRLSNLLGLLREEFPEIYLIVALTDLYINSQHRPVGDDPFYKTHTDPDGREWTLLGREWFAGGYEQNYRPFVDTIVPAFKDEPRIMAWDIGNELKLPEDRPLFIEFNHALADRIKSLDPRHLVTTGMMSTRHAGLWSPGQHRLYKSPHIDFVTSHIYNADYGDDDSALATELNKPFLVEEAGFDPIPEHQDRTDRVRQDMDVMFGRGACGYMQWAFMAGGDNGDGDRDRGMDRHFHPDWDGLWNVYTLRVKALHGLPV
jgi:hypothetical protein